MFLKRTWAEIDTSALIHNYKLIKSKTGNSHIMAVVKADAYGHTTEIVVPALEKAGVDSYAVSNLQEALELRELGVKSTILVLGYTPPEAFDTLAKYGISQTVYDVENAYLLSQSAQKVGIPIHIHIKLDTGMSRIGFDCRNDSLCGISEILKVLEMKMLKFEGIFTHFSVADSSSNDDKAFTQAQYTRFCKAVSYLEEYGYKPDFIHCCNSAGILNYPYSSDTNLCRAGIALYGLDPESKGSLDGFLPVMSFKSTVSFIKEIKKGDSVSYGRSFTAPKDMKIATVSAGYADGFPRKLSGKGYVLINGKKAEIIGKICMDQFMVDITEIDVKSGDEVLLFGNDLPVEEVAKAADTINYEIICGISKRVPRILKKEGNKI